MDETDAQYDRIKKLRETFTPETFHLGTWTTWDALGEQKRRKSNHPKRDKEKAARQALKDLNE